jgi:hypothetical protein
MSEIQRLRDIGSLDGSVSFYSSSDNGFREKVEEVECILDGGTVVDREFEEGGRWSNYETTIHKLTEGDEVAYFLVMQERPATESQDGMDCQFEFYEVEPYEVTITKYRGVN